MKFAHLGDCHLGGWKHPELKELNLKSFQYAIDKCIKYKVDFIINKLARLNKRGIINTDLPTWTCGVSGHGYWGELLNNDLSTQHPQ